MENYINLIKKLFSKVSIEELNQRIKFYQETVQKSNLSEEIIKKEVNSIFRVDGLSFFINNNVETQKYHRFYYYRIRKFSENESDRILNKEFTTMVKESDAWSRPAEQIEKYGRLNRPKQSVLYASSQIENAIHETGCAVGEFFFIMIYHNKRQMIISQIHDVIYLDYLSELENAKRIILHNFLISEFTKYVPRGKEFMYKNSLIIYEEFFKSDKIDAFTYPSIASRKEKGFDSGYNICFDEISSKQNLNLLGVMVCRRVHDSYHTEMNLEHIYNGFLNNDRTFEFHSVNSSISKEKFGDFMFHLNSMKI